ncbi:MAG: hypothetical protein KatS3mg057_2091 [Herpetosiphonaceae bacterium]|nr:MAG: hypothetical protein KatS3mg057_2091 [Herpetosiphonaceae bacterium]
MDLTSAGMFLPTGLSIATLIPTNGAFYIELSSITEGIFFECSGLEAEIKTKEVREGGRNDYVHRLPEGIAYRPITLKSGLVTKDVWKWFMKCAEGKIDRRDFSIVVYGPPMVERLRWDVKGAWPVKWSGPGFNTKQDEFLIQSIELAHQGFELKTGPL